jgi:hypothetical protein
MVNFWGTLLYINVMIMLGASGSKTQKKYIFNYIQTFILSLLSTELEPY